MFMRRLTWSVLAAGVAVAGLSIALPSVAAASRAAGADRPAAARAASAGRPLLGVDLYATGNYRAAQVQADGARMLTYIKKTLRADAVGIVWNLYAPSRTSDTVKTTSKTLSAANVKILTQIAEKDGLKVFYRPLIFVESGGSAWEGVIAPARPAAWFASYYKAELPYLKAAQEYHISQFVADTEMHNMNRNAGWSGFYAKIAKVYRGTISYAAWDGDYFPPQQHLQRLSALGMDFYEDMPRLSPSASEAKVLAGWEGYFRRVSRSVLRRTTIDEIGIEARSGAYAKPQNLGAPGRADQEVQANWFTAACKTARAYDLGGVFFWKVDLADNPAHPSAALSVFEGRQGARAIAACATILG
jgi:hypothetical protein